MGTFINITVIVIGAAAVGLLIWTKLRNKSCCSGCSGNRAACSSECKSRNKKREDGKSE